MNEIDMKSLWKQQEIPDAKLSSIQERIRRFRLHRIIEACAIMLMTVIPLFLGISIWICWTPELLVTRVGIILLSISFMLPAISFGRMLYLYHRLRMDCANKNYVNRLLQIKRLERRQQHVFLNLYFIAFSLGLGCYLYEYTLERSLFWGVIAYAALLTWIAINCFFLRPRIIKKRNEAWNYYLKDMESYQKSLSE